MFKKILVPTDGSELSEKAVSAAIDFAATTGAELVAMSVAEPIPHPLLGEGSGLIPFSTDAADKYTRDAATKIVESVALRAQQKNVPCTTSIASSFMPYEEILAAARQSGCDIIFMASHGRKGLNKLFVGSETQKVLAQADIPVLVFR